MFFEKEYFSKSIEPEYSQLLKKIIQAGEQYALLHDRSIILTPEEKFSFAYLLAVQWHRLSDRKEQWHSFKQDTINAEVGIIKNLLASINNNPAFLDLQITGITDPSLDHAETYADPEFIEGLANVLANHYWEFYYTNTEQIYSSDYPIVIEPHVKNARVYYEGFGMYGAEISIPISKKIVLVVWESQYFEEKENLDCQFSELDSKGVRRYNLMRYYYAKEKLFCSTNDFSVVETELLTNNNEEIFLEFTPRYKIYH